MDKNLELQQERSCGTCAWHRTNPQNVQELQCRRHPPTIAVIAMDPARRMPVTLTISPIVDRTYFCGDHETPHEAEQKRRPVWSLRKN
jgi:hypothetical protein